MNLRIALVGSLCVLTSLSASGQSLQWTTGAELPGVSVFPGAGPISISALETFDDGNGLALYAGGGFLSAGGVNANCIARWDGQAWSPVALNFNPSTNGWFHVYALLAEGPQLYIGGKGPDSFYPPKGFVSQIGLSNGLIGTFSPADENTHSEVRALALFDGVPTTAGSEFYAGGTFPFGSIYRREGAAWHSLGGGSMPGVQLELPGGFSGPATVLALQVFDDGNGSALYVGGTFNFAGGIPQRSVACWNGSAWSGFSGPISEFGTCSALAVYDDGSGSGLGLYAAAQSGRVLRLVGTSWSEVATANGAIAALEVFDDGAGRALYAAGKFSSIGGTTALGVAKWNGVSWSALAGGIGVGGVPVSEHALALKGSVDLVDSTGTALYVGGTFNSADGAPVEKLAAWRRSEAVGTTYCFGDGSLPTPCPCAPPDVVPSPSGAPDAGCANSFNLDGARLVATGPLNPDHGRLLGTGLTPVGFSIFLVGNGNEPTGVAGGDGIRCVGGSFFRFGVQSAVNGTILYPNPALGLTHPLSVMSSVVPGSGQSRYYQAFYRNAQPGFCNPATFNFTSAVELVW